MNKGEKVTIQILGLGIMKSEYCSITDCALAKATKRYFNTDNVNAGGRTIIVGNKDFEINTDQFNTKIFRDLKDTLTEDQANKIVVEVELTYFEDIT